MSSDPLRIVQISDVHILADPDGRIFGVDPFAALERLLDMIAHDPWKPDLFVITGDLSDDGSPASYRRLCGLFASQDIPAYCTTGNHDDLAAMREHLAGGPIRLTRRVIRDGWQIVFLDSQVPGKAHGHLSDDELGALERALQDAPEHDTLVALHHGPLSVCCTSGCRLADADELMDLLTDHPQVRGVISGHTHSVADEERSGIRLMIAPSTCVQASHPQNLDEPDAHRFSDVHDLDTARRGYRKLELRADGTIVTEVVWDYEKLDAPMTKRAVPSDSSTIANPAS